VLLLLLFIYVVVVVVVVDDVVVGRGGVGWWLCCHITQGIDFILLFIIFTKKTPQTHMPSTSMNPELSWSISLNTRWYSANDRDLMLSSCCSVTTYSAFRNKYLVA